MICPSFGFLSPSISRNKVVLPQPLGAISKTFSPSFTSKDTSLKISL
ncbi:hypothetical protein HMPREF0493_0874 [Lactobacillus amylolyticus DSM 11664]|uniref:Uncharacterized protein n=1 Tax=Lactobacillus amylolyticus DSM 11664 TaxID=585524 RepID=D4YTL3_9LACO|nr:hypothetical protein HMPREF0493_0874 [Lactobacillus amylolyticus DSM 11664]